MVLYTKEEKNFQHDNDSFVVVSFDYTPLFNQCEGTAGIDRKIKAHFKEKEEPDQRINFSVLHGNAKLFVKSMSNTIPKRSW